MAFKKPATPSAAAESPDRLFLDLPRRKHPSLFDHQGQILRNYATQALTSPDVALQLPTGSGKTLVGLLLAEWRRRKFREKVVYLCPTRQLVNQVVDEATFKYGLNVQGFTGAVKAYTPDARNSYDNADRVAIATYSSLFNTNPFFANPDIIILDDAHASENYVAKLWTMTLNRDTETDTKLFSAIASVLKPVLHETTYRRLVGDAQVDDITWSDKVPTPKLREVVDELSVVISGNATGDHRYVWQMLCDHLLGCQIYISSNELMIRPLIPPTWDHIPFDSAKQRVYMSATLGAGGDLERLTGRAKILRLPIPQGWDQQGIGRRFFIFPEKSLNETEVAILRQRLMKEAGRSLVLTPSNETAEAVTSDVASKLGYPVFSGSDLEDKKPAFVSTRPAVAVIANRYDGIDLPDDECRLLFIEGLPRAANLQEKFLMNRMGANILFNERVQTRVLQAIGRCTRGLNDYSAVVVTGEDLPVYLTDHRRRSYLHPELQAELEFGVTQSTKTTLDEIVENFSIFLRHDSEWEDANADILETRSKSTQQDLPAVSELGESVRYEIAWQKALWSADYVPAYDAAREVLAKLDDSALRGYRALWHYLAGSSAELAAAEGDTKLASAAKAQFREAKKAATGITWMTSLSRADDAAKTAEERHNSAVMLQVERLEGHLSKLGTLNNRSFTAYEERIREGIATGKDFEQAQVLLGEHLGFQAGKKEADGSPDPWWIVGDYAIVFEDHANAGANAVVDATKARQAYSHPNWLSKNVAGADKLQIQPVLVTPAKKAKKGAIPHLAKVAFWSLDDFRKWVDEALVAVRDLRREFVEPGDLAWRAEAASKLTQIRADGYGLHLWLTNRPADRHLESVD